MTARDSVAWRWAELVEDAAFLRAQASPVRVPLNDYGQWQATPPRSPSGCLSLGAYKTPFIPRDEVSGKEA